MKAHPSWQSKVKIQSVHEYEYILIHYIHLKFSIDRQQTSETKHLRLLELHQIHYNVKVLFTFEIDLCERYPILGILWQLTPLFCFISVYKKLMLEEVCKLFTSEMNFYNELLLYKSMFLCMIIYYFLNFTFVCLWSVLLFSTFSLF